MGQKSDKFVQHDSVDDRSGVYKQSTTAPSTAKTDHSPVSCKTDGEANKGFWRRLADDILGQDVSPEFQKYQMFTTFSDPHFPLWFDLEPNNDAVQNPVAGERDLDIQLEYYENPSMFGLGVNFGTYEMDEMFGGAKPGLANREDLKDSRWAGLFFGHENRCCWRWAHTQIRKDGWIRNANRNQCWSRMPGPILIPNPPLGKVALLAAGFAGTTVQDDLKAEDPADGLQTLVHSGSDDDPGFDLIDDGGDQISSSHTMSLSHEKLEDDEDPNETKEVIVKINGCRYKIGRELGAGGFGVVFEATRVHDDLKVALKIVEKTEDVIQSYIKIPGYPELVPLEIGLHKLATTGEHVPVIIELLDWMDNYGYIYMILERPSPCEDVLSFVNRHGGITENMAKAILRQAIEASEICFKRGVFHRDLKLSNFLINPNTLEVKLIDFGAGDIYKTSTYKEFLGTEEYICPEYLKTGEYHCKPATVYSLGVLLFSMVCGYHPSSTDLHQIKEKTWRKDGLTKECCNLIQACMQLNPDERIHLEKILDHAWFKDKDPADGLQTPVHSGSDDDPGFDLIDDGGDQISSSHTMSLSHEKLEDDEDPNETKEVIVKINGCRYKIGRELGAGGFGVVFEATRVHDDLKVALKIVEKTEDVIQSYIKIPGYPELVPLEIGLHKLATTGEHVPVIIELLDWMDNYGYIYMILERPSPCEDVLSFVNRHGGITENMAKAILRQAIEASEICFKRGVFHRDLKLSNFLINPNTLEVKLINFGAGRIYKTSTYKEFLGTEEYICPEYLKTGEYHCKPATVYSLGVLLFSMVCGYHPSSTDLHQIKEETWRKDGLTKECCDLIQACMQLNPDERIHLEKILDHAWFKDKDPADGLQTPIHSGSDDVIQYPDDAGSDGSDDGEVEIPPLPLISVSHERLDDDEDPNVTTEIEINGRQFEIDRMVDKGGFGAVNEGTCVKDCLKVALKVAGKNIIRLLPDLLRMT